MHQPEDPNMTIEIVKPKIGFWQRLGGTSLTIALLVHLVVLIIGAYWIFQVIYPPEKKVDFMPPGGGGGARGAETKVNTKKRAQITPTTNVKRVFAEGASSNFAIPDPGDNFGEMSALSSLSSGGPSGGLGGSGSGGGFGAGTGNGAGLGMGNGSGKLFGLIPETMRKRCSKDDRHQRLKENGGSDACDEAVSKALRWLKANQKADGSFGSSNKVAMTGLALLAYFGHCETPASEEFGDSCLKGIVFLVDVASKNEGRMATNYTVNSWPYEHAIATYALGEAYTFCKELKVNVPNLPEMTEKAGQYIIDKQHKNGGWAYAYNESTGAHTDVSVSGWHIQALKACSHTSIRYRGMSTAITKGLKYINDCQDKSGGFGYTNTALHAGHSYYTLTGVGVLCNQMWGKGSRSEVSKGLDYIKKNTKLNYNGADCDLYAHYYESQAMMQAGGEFWKHYNDLFRDQILLNQAPDGSWKTPGGGKTPNAIAPAFMTDVVYRTCLCTLMLEVYYRFLSTDKGLRSRGGAID